MKNKKDQEQKQRKDESQGQAKTQSRQEPLKDAHTESTDSLDFGYQFEAFNNSSSNTNLNSSTLDSSRKMKKKPWYSKLHFPKFGQKKHGQGQKEGTGERIDSTSETPLVINVPISKTPDRGVSTHSQSMIISPIGQSQKQMHQQMREKLNNLNKSNTQLQTSFHQHPQHHSSQQLSYTQSPYTASKAQGSQNQFFASQIMHPAPNFGHQSSVKQRPNEQKLNQRALGVGANRKLTTQSEQLEEEEDKYGDYEAFKRRLQHSRDVNEFDDDQSQIKCVELNSDETHSLEQQLQVHRSPETKQDLMRNHRPKYLQQSMISPSFGGPMITEQNRYPYQETEIGRSGYLMTEDQMKGKVKRQELGDLRTSGGGRGGGGDSSNRGRAGVQNEKSISASRRATNRETKNLHGAQKSMKTQIKQNKKLNDKFMGSFIGQISTQNTISSSAAAKKKHTANVDTDLLEKILNQSRNILSMEERLKLLEIVIKGVPYYLRAKLWLVSTGAEQVVKDKQNILYYKKLVEDQSLIYPNSAFYQIELDLQRTFPSDLFFKREENIQKIRRILVAYVKRNPFIGYCQGLNFIIGRLIKCLTEVEAFWVFVQLLESILPIDYYTQMMGVQTDMKIFNMMIKESLPQVYQKFIDLKFDPMYFSLNWFICLFTDKLSEQVRLIALTLLNRYRKLYLILCFQLAATFYSILASLFSTIFEIRSQNAMTFVIVLLYYIDLESLFLLIDNHHEYVRDPHKLLNFACFESKELKIMKPSEVYSLRMKLAYETLFEKKLSELNKMNSQINTASNPNQKLSAMELYQRKSKFLSRFQLFNGLSKLKNSQFYQNDAQLFPSSLNLQRGTISPRGDRMNSFSAISDMTFENNSIQHYPCKCNWPICMFDFTFKVCMPDQFVYRPSKTPTIINNYFDFNNLPKSNDFLKQQNEKHLSKSSVNRYQTSKELGQDIYFQTEQAQLNQHESRTPCMRDLMQFSLEDQTSNFKHLDLRESYDFSSSSLAGIQRKRTPVLIKPPSELITHNQRLATEAQRAQEEAEEIFLLQDDMEDYDNDKLQRELDEELLGSSNEALKMVDQPRSPSRIVAYQKHRVDPNREGKQISETQLKDIKFSSGEHLSAESNGVLATRFQQLAATEIQIQTSNFMESSVEDLIQERKRMFTERGEAAPFINERERADLSKIDFDDLLMFRGKHYCQDPLFLTNFRKLYQLENMDLIESQEILSNLIVDQVTATRIMENFVRLTIQVNARSKKSTSILRKRSKQEDLDPRAKNSGNRKQDSGSPLTMQQLIEGNEEEPSYLISPRTRSNVNKSIISRMRSSIRKEDRRQRTINLSTFTFPEQYVLTTGSIEKRRGERTQYIAETCRASRQRPRSQNFHKYDLQRLSKNSGSQGNKKAIADIKQMEAERFKFMQKYRSKDQLKLIRRLTKRGDFQGSLKSKDSY